MSNYPTLQMSKEMDTERPLKVLKRRTLMRIQFLKGDEARKHCNTINGYIFFCRNLETRFALKRGDVLLANFEFECGCEINGPHYVAVLNDSSELSQIVTVIPLKSKKEGKPLNPASDVYLGEIENLVNGKEAVAVINQIRTIDKRRFYAKGTIDTLNNLYKRDDFQDYKEIIVQMKRCYRLTDEQYEKMHKAVMDYVFNGYIKH